MYFYCTSFRLYNCAKISFTKYKSENQDQLFALELWIMNRRREPKNAVKRL